jgi:hypothetical protein
LAAYYQRLAGGEAVVWLMIPLKKLGLGIELKAAWGLDEEGYIVVSLTTALW